MEKYIFILGRDPELSILELKSYLKSREIKHNILESTKEILLIELPALDFKKMIKDLGGIVKIGKTNFKHFYDGSNKNILYGINNYSYKQIDIRDKFEEEGVKAYLNAKGRISPSKSLNLDEEFIIFKNHIAKVVAVFNPKDYKKRDKRPHLDPLRVSSIRLSKILINLSGAKEGSLLLDPFCGLGTILQEALLMNIDVIGIEKDKVIANKCKENLEWIKKKGWEVIDGDSESLSRYIKQADCVATEPYLGPFLKNYPSEENAKRTARFLEEIYTNVLRQLKKVVKGRIAIITPWFRTKNRKDIKINFRNILRKTGFEPLPQYPINYGEESLVKREIWVIERS